MALLAHCRNYSNSQETTNPAGGNASDSGGKIIYSFGQVVYNNNTGSNENVAKGVQ
jgi:hypothetical protein